MVILEKLKRIPNKIKREILPFTGLKVALELAHKKEVEQHFNYLPEISPVDSTLVSSLRQEGAVVTSLEALGVPSTSLLLISVEKILPKLMESSSNEKHAISLPLSKLMEYPEIFLWGIEERLLNIVENYIGLPVLYHGVDFRREIANGKLTDVRQWHIDVEDHRMVKIIIYLNDVRLNGGPFEYISKHLTSLLCQTLQYSSGFVPDKVIKNVVPTSDWKSCTGGSGTVTFSDTCNVFHRAKPPVEADRFSITFSYTSRRPITTYSKDPLFKNEMLKISSRLSSRQRECILGNSKLF